MRMCFFFSLKIGVLGYLGHRNVILEHYVPYMKMRLITLTYSCVRAQREEKNMRKHIKSIIAASLVVGVTLGSLRIHADDITTSPVTQTEVADEASVIDPTFDDIVDVQEQKAADKERDKAISVDADNHDVAQRNLELKNEDKEVTTTDEPEQENQVAVPTEVVKHTARLQVLAEDTTLEVGKTVSYRIVFGVDGGNNVIPNLDLTLQLPSIVGEQGVIFNQDLETLAIRGVVPEYDAVTKQITYHFQNISGGFDTSMILKLETENGSALNLENLTVTASVAGSTISEVTSEATTTLIANQNASISNKLRGIIVNGVPVDRSSIRYLDDAVFAVGFSISRFETGTVAPSTEGTMRFDYTLPEGVDYVSDTSGVTPEINGKTITWHFDANQNADEEYYFNVNFNIVTKVSGNLALFSTVDTVASSNVSFIDGSSKAFETKASVMISPNFEYAPDALFGGGPLTSVFSGPADGIGGVGWINNDDPSVTDGATLGWRLYLSSLDATSPIHGINSYDAFFMPDEALNVTQIYTGTFYQRPSSAFPAGIPVEEDVFFSLSYRYVGETEWQRSVAALQPESYYHAEDIGIDPNKKISEVWFHFYDGEHNVFADTVDFDRDSIFKLPKGLTNMNLTIFTSVDQGYVGPIQSNAGIAYSGWYPQKDDLTNSYRTDQQSKYVPEDVKVSWYSDVNSQYESRLAPKTAQVVTAPEGISRYIKSNISLSDSKYNLINSGDNYLRLDINNDVASTQALSGPFTMYALIDHGVTVKDLEAIPNATVTVVDENYHDANKTLLKIEMAVDRLEINRRAVVRIPVHIAENAPNRINVELFGYLNEDFSVSDVSNVDGSFTIRESDRHDFNGNGNVEELIYTTKNTYTYRNAYDFVATNTVDSNVVTSVNPNSTQVVDLTVFNEKDTPFTSLELIGVLPSIEDTFVLSDTERSSKFDLSLSGPIILPEGYEDAFDVTYSTSKEPSIVNVLDRHTDADLKPIDYPSQVDDQPWVDASEVSDFSTIKSFRISLKAGAGPISQDALNFKLPTQVQTPQLTGDEALNDRTAFLSFAVGANQANVFETQALSFVYEKTPIYTIEGDNVTMYLKDVQAHVASGNLISKIIEFANPLVQKNDITILNPNVGAVIINAPEVYTAGVYEVQLSYYDTARAARVQTTITLTVLADPTAPIEPIDPTDPTNPTDPVAPTQPEVGEDVLPNTGVASNNVGYILVTLGLGMIAFTLIKRKYQYRRFQD